MPTPGLTDVSSLSVSLWVILIPSSSVCQLSAIREVAEGALFQALYPTSHSPAEGSQRHLQVRRKSLCLLLPAIPHVPVITMNTYNTDWIPEITLFPSFSSQPLPSTLSYHSFPFLFSVKPYLLSFSLFRKQDHKLTGSQHYREYASGCISTFTSLCFLSFFIRTSLELHCLGLCNLFCLTHKASKLDYSYLYQHCVLLGHHSRSPPCRKIKRIMLVNTQVLYV